ncbi:hypothetical protein BGX21_008102 [Mortierella sp. AD011]|nr:hypothetical protein BGX21_008102 [Mortierella sp. AD011]
MAAQMEGDRDTDPINENSVKGLSLEEADENILNCLERIERNSGVRGGKPTVTRALSALNPVVQTFGLSPEQLTQLLDIILAGKIDDVTTRKLIKQMLPRQQVPEICAIKILGCLGRQLSFACQAALLKWVIVIYDILENRTKLHQLYGVAFHYLSYETLRPPLCHILYYLTQREDVRPFRIRKLMDLQIIVGKEPALIGLLHTYKSYSPDLILAPLTTSNQTIFKCPDQAMSTLIMELQEKWSHLGTSQAHELSLNGSKEPIMKTGIKRKNISQSSIPDSLSIYRKGNDDKALPLSQITSLDSLVEHIDTLALPDQLSSVLSNRLLQHVVCLQPSNSIVERISYWLGQELMDLWYWREKTDSTRSRFAIILSKVVEDLLPVMENFLIPYLRVWNGVEHQKEIFTLLTYLRPRSYEELYAHFLKPLHSIFYLMGPVWKGELLLCFTKLLQHWAQIKWKDYLEIGRAALLSKKGVEGLRRVFSKLAPNVDYMKTIRAFIRHVDNISGVALEIERNHIAVQHGVLSFFDLASSLTKTYKLPLVVVIPDSFIVYRCFLSDSGMSISRLCGILYQYKQAFEAFELEQQLQYDLLVQSQMSSQEMTSDGQAPSVPKPVDIPGYSREYVILFNSFVMDVCNLLWRNRAFNKTDKNAQGFLVDSHTIAQTKQICVDGGLSINNMFSVTHSSVMSGYSARFLKSLEDQQNIPADKRLIAPASVPALKDMVARGGLNITFEDYRVQYLDYLEQKGFDGVTQFLFDCMTNLLQRRLQNQQKELKEKSDALESHPE